MALALAHLIRDGKGAKDRVTMLPERLRAPLEEQIRRVRQVHEADLGMGFGDVWLPYALAVKYPNAAGTLAGSMCFRP